MACSGLASRSRTSPPPGWRTTSARFSPSASSATAERSALQLAYARRARTHPLILPISGSVPAFYASLLQILDRSRATRVAPPSGSDRGGGDMRKRRAGLTALAGGLCALGVGGASD